MENLYEEIKENLSEISKAIDWIGDTNLRRFIDSHVVIIHLKARSLPTKAYEDRAEKYWNEMNK